MPAVMPQFLNKNYAEGKKGAYVLKTRPWDVSGGARRLYSSFRGLRRRAPHSLASASAARASLPLPK